MAVDDPQRTVHLRGLHFQIADANIRLRRFLLPQQYIANGIAAPNAVEKIDDILLFPAERTLELGHSQAAAFCTIGKLGDGEGFGTGPGLNGCHEAMIIQPADAFRNPSAPNPKRPKARSAKNPFNCMPVRTPGCAWPPRPAA